MNRCAALLLLMACAEPARLEPDCALTERACVGDDTCIGHLSAAQLVGANNHFVRIDGGGYIPAYYTFMDDGRVCAIVCCDGGDDD